jgi:hypothetical protein
LTTFKYLITQWSWLAESNKFKFPYIFGMGVVMVALIAGTIFSSVSMDSVFGKPVDGSQQKCTSTFWTRTCCWAEDNGSFIHERCETCIDYGDGTYGQCTIDDHPFREANDNRVPNDGGVLAESEESDEKTDNQVPNDGGVLAESEESNQGTGVQAPFEGGVFSKQP